MHTFGFVCFDAFNISFIFYSFSVDVGLNQGWANFYPGGPTVDSTHLLHTVFYGKILTVKIILEKKRL